MTTPERPPLWTPSFCAVAAGNFLLFFSFYLLLPILPMYVGETFGVDKAITGMVLASYTIMALLVRPVSGYMVDTFPRKKLLLICYTIFMLFFCGYLLAGTLILFTLIRATHGAAFGLVTVSNSTMAIDIMPAQRRGEGIGYYGVSNNLAMAIGPSLSLYFYESLHEFTPIFMISVVTSFLGLCCVSMIKAPVKAVEQPSKTLSLDRFILVKGLPEMLPVILFSFSYGILSTYLAVYGRTEVGITGGTGLFFVIMACGLVMSRLRVGQMLNRGLVWQSVATGMLICLLGLALFVIFRVPVGFYLAAFVLGVGFGTMCSALQAMFINLAPNSRRGTANSTYFTAWDLGIGLGVFIGGHIAEVASYAMAYRVGLCVSAVGFMIFYFVVRYHFERNKLR
ncbi:MAG: MFS transporter [Bacteroidaceae bacterium]|nr:MFS transporter [Bacteroidaceae bacterium]